MRSSLGSSLLPLLLLGACATARPAAVTLRPQVMTGPAAGSPPGRVLVLHAACGSVDLPCPQSYIETVDAIVRGGLEFAGYNLVESDSLRNQTRQRHEEHSSTNSSSGSSSQTKVEGVLIPDETTTSTSSSGSSSESHYVVLDGPGFDDLSVDERHAVLAKSGATSVLSVRIIVGANTGVWTANQSVEVMVKLGVNQGDAMAWSARCLASSNDFATVNSALENAARCAIYGGTGQQAQR